MPTIAKLPSGSWRAQVRCKGRYVSETFLRRDDALRWSRLAELSVDRNETPVSSRIGRLTTFGELVRLHIEDMTCVGKPPRRSKAATLDLLQRELGSTKITALDREWLIQFGRTRSEAGAGHVGQHIGFGIIHDYGQLRHLGPDLVGDGTPLAACGLGGVLGDPNRKPPVTTSARTYTTPWDMIALRLELTGTLSREVVYYAPLPRLIQE